MDACGSIVEDMGTGADWAARKKDRCGEGECAGAQYFVDASSIGVAASDCAACIIERAVSICPVISTRLSCSI